MLKKIFLSICLWVFITIFFSEASPSKIVINVGEDPSQSVIISWKNLLSEPIDTFEIIAINQDYLVIESHNVYQVIGKVVDYDTKRRLSYQVTLKHLNQATTYMYKIGTSPYQSFETLKKSSPLTLGFIGDLQGYRPAQYHYFKKIYEALIGLHRLDVTLYAGDLVDKANAFDQWAYFDAAMGDYLSTTLNAAAMGNHDDGKVFIQTFVAPKNGVDGLENSNYYFELEACIIAIINTEQLDLFEEQSDWLKKIMKNKNKFKIVLMHRAAYPISYNEQWIRAWSKAFDGSSIDLVLSGHDHIYSRTTMDHASKVGLNSGVTYVVGGSGSGSKFYNQKYDRDWSNIIYDDNHAVVSSVHLTDNTLEFKAYSYFNNKLNLIDHFIKNK